MRKLLGFLSLLCGFFWFATAHATVRIGIDLSTQTMQVQSASGSYTWPVSTARDGYVTPRGTFRPYAMQLMHYSRKYDNSPMPHSIFFDGGLAIHGTYETAWLGHPASHGCVRISPAHAALLYQMVKAEGAVITISGTPPHFYARARRPAYGAAPGYGYPAAYAPAVYDPQSSYPGYDSGGWQFTPFAPFGR